MSGIIAVLKEGIRFRIDLWSLGVTVWRLKMHARRYGVDRSVRKLLKRLEPKSRFLADNVATVSVPIQRALAQDAPRFLRMINSIEYVRERGISQELFTQATIKTLDRNRKYLHRFYNHVVVFRRIHFPNAPAIELREGVVAVETLSTEAKGFIGYLSTVILAGIYLGRPVFTGNESAGPIHYAVVFVSLSAALVLARVLTHRDYWMVEE